MQMYSRNLISEVFFPFFALTGSAWLEYLFSFCFFFYVNRFVLCDLHFLFRARSAA